MDRAVPLNLQIRKLWRIAALALLGLLPVGLCHALDAQLNLSQLHHTAWTARDGAPTDIAAIAQTRDGYLWLATPGGLFKFDGLRFERLDLFPGEPQRSQHVFGLRGLPDGSLWIGYRRGGASVLRGRVLKHYLAPTDLGKSSIYGFDQGKDGVVWAGGSAGLYRLNGEHWQLIASDRGDADAYLSDWRMDPQGGLWAKGRSRWYTLVPGSERFEKRDDLGDTQDIAFALDGSLWRWAQGGDIGPQAPSAKGVRWTPPFNAGALMFDRQGSLWVSSYGQGLQRMAQPLRPSSQAERFTKKDGLSGDNIKSAFEDREGNLWFGSTQGLDRFRNPRAVLAPFPGGPDGGPIAAGEQGEVWAAGFNKAPVRLTPGGLFKTVAGDYGDDQKMFVSAYRDADGSLWFGSTPGLWHSERDGRMRRVATPAKVPALQAVQAITRDRAGVLWVSFGSAGLFGLKEGQWQEPDARWPRGLVTSLLTDADGVLWLGYADNRIARIEGDTVQSFGGDEGLDLGYVAALYARSGRLWAGGIAGLALLDQGRFSAVARDDGQPFRSITGIIGTPNGALWLNDDAGIVQIPASEIGQRLAEPAHRLHIDLRDQRDGVLGIPVTPRPLPSVVAASDGRLWFTRSNAIYWIDPQTDTAAPQAPALITALSVGEHSLAPEPGLQLPIGTRQLRIAYTALNLGTPERTRFRYKLEGVDEDWQQAGTRREAAYTNLGPGRYRFVVNAAFGNAAWVETGDSLDFTVLPAFYQTQAFMALCLLALAAFAWALHRWRIHLNCLRVQERIEARLAERERIARELHDTLLQSTAGLMLQFQAALDEMPPEQAARRGIALALDKADGVLVEGRERVLDLRSHQQDEELSQALFDLASAVSNPAMPTLSRKLQGRPRPLCAAIWAEAYRIGQEAIFNAQRHAQAATIAIEMDYAASGPTLRVRDDGIGIAPELLAAGARPGHWGLVGMRERAVQMEAQLTVTSTPGAGTEVRLRMGSVAYLPEQGGSLFGRWWAWSLRGRRRR